MKAKLISILLLLISFKSFLAAESNGRILVISKDAKLTNHLQINAPEYNYSLLVGNDYSDDLEADVIAIDLDLSDPISLVEKVRKHTRAPIIIIVPQTEEGNTDKIVTLRLGGDAFLYKPVEPDDFFQQAHALLKRAAHEQEMKEAYG